MSAAVCFMISGEYPLITFGQSPPPKQLGWCLLHHFSAFSESAVPNVLWIMQWKILRHCHIMWTVKEKTFYKFLEIPKSILLILTTVWSYSLSPSICGADEGVLWAAGWSGGTSAHPAGLRRMWTVQRQPQDIRVSTVTLIRKASNLHSNSSACVASTCNDGDYGPKYWKRYIVERPLIKLSIQNQISHVRLPTSSVTRDLPLINTTARDYCHSMHWSGACPYLEQMNVIEFGLEDCSAAKQFYFSCFNTSHFSVVRMGTTSLFPQHLRALKHEINLLYRCCLVATQCSNVKRTCADTLCDSESKVLHRAHLNICGAASTLNITCCAGKDILFSYWPFQYGSSNSVEWASRLAQYSSAWLCSSWLSSVKRSFDSTLILVIIVILSLCVAADRTRSPSSSSSTSTTWTWQRRAPSTWGRLPACFWPLSTQTLRFWETSTVTLPGKH